MPPETRAEPLIELVGNLIDIMEQENALLERPSSEELGPVISEKMALFQDYENQLQDVARNPGFAINLDETEKTELRALSQRFEEVQKINEQKLRIAVKSSNIIVERIKEAATRAAGTSLNAYGKGGTQGAYQKKAAPVAVNETL